MAVIPLIMQASTEVEAFLTDYETTLNDEIKSYNPRAHAVQVLKHKLEAVVDLRKRLRSIVGSVIGDDHLKAVANHAEFIIDAHTEGANADEGVDAGEFSGPAHDRLQEREIRDLCRREAVDYDALMDEIVRRANEQTLNAMSEPGQDPSCGRQT